MTERMLRATTHVTTFHDSRPLSTFTGFFFLNGGRVYLITCQHSLTSKVHGHRPNRLEYMVRAEGDAPRGLQRRSIMLGDLQACHWRSGYDRFGDIDIAAIEISMEPGTAEGGMACFEQDDLVTATDRVAVGDPVLMVVYPPGCSAQDAGWPLVRHAVLASSMDGRFQGQSCFLTDTPLQPGTSGAPVLVRRLDASVKLGEQPWQLIGVHSATFDGVGGSALRHGVEADMSCNWYADILPLLTSADLH
ncbi:MAG: hypothetical protein RI907_3674 [Pseudomonadota bacterium]|jgi:hypothetical protein